MVNYNIHADREANREHEAQPVSPEPGDIAKAAERGFAPNRENQGDGLDLLSAIEDNSMKAVFLDPEYRGVLDKLRYGNEGHGRGQARAALAQMDDEQISRFVAEIDRILMPSGHFFLWTDKFSLFESVRSWIVGTNLSVVDLVIWDKGSIGMGWRTRHRSEFLVVLQKSPRRAKGIWTDRSLPDVWHEKVKKNHTHSKPVGLQRRLIEAVTEEGDWVLDPAAGGYSVLKAAQSCNRNFIGCDIATQS